MKFIQYINEDINSEIFIRLGPMSGQKQTHKGNKRAPARKGIWLIPVQAKKHDLSFLGGYVGKDKNKHRLRVDDKDFEKTYGITLDDYTELSYIEMEKLDNKILNKRIKKDYKTLKLKPTDMVWTHLGSGQPNAEFDVDWPWYKVSVKEYWKLFRKTFSSELKKGWGIDGEWAEIFWETT